MKVVLHKSTDGVLHESAKLCAAHNVELRVKTALAGVSLNCDSLEDSDRGSRVLYSEDIDKFIAANHVALRKLLNDALIVKRPRKARKSAASLMGGQATSGLTLVAA